jgi:glutathione S-transferase
MIPLMPDAVATAPVLLYALPPIWGTPSPSPFVIKLLTWLRMAGIPYEIPALTRPPASPTRKIPYVELPDGRLLYDSTLIIETLGRERGIDLDAGLDAVTRARGLAIRRMCEDHLYFAGAWERWEGNGARHTRADYFRHLPALLRPVAAAIAGRGMRKNLQGHGLGRLPAPEIRRAAAADLDALAALLGESPFVLGLPSTVDATVVGFLWSGSANPFPSAVGEAIGHHPNLMAYLDRMRGRYWADWAP